MRHLLILTIFTSLPVFLSAQTVEADAVPRPVARPAPVAPAVASAAAKPGELRGTVITREHFKPLTGKQRWTLYWRQTYWSPGPYVSAFGIAGSDQYSNQPYEWGQGFDAYMKRAGDNLARQAMRGSIEAAGAAALKQDVRYVKCGCKGVLKRTVYAIGMNFATLNEKGAYRPAYARFAGALGAPFIADTWMPAGYRNWNSNLRDGGLNLAYTAAFNVIREFFPLKKKT